MGCLPVGPFFRLAVTLRPFLNITFHFITKRLFLGSDNEFWFLNQDDRKLVYESGRGSERVADSSV